jgi:uncharacterized lipoprotein YddW (UPF0748 family)
VSLAASGHRILPLSALAAMLAAGAMIGAGTSARAAEEVRALWVVRHSITSPEKVAKLVRQAEKAGFDTLLVQIRGRGDAYYASTLEPAPAGLADGFDPLAETIRQAHKVGIAVHAWVNVMYVWSAAEPPAEPNHILNAHPEWLSVDRGGNRPLKAGKTEGAFLCPTDPDARGHVRALLKDLTKRYDVDGIHLDYIRYPEADFCYCPRCLEAFRAACLPEVEGPITVAQADETGEKWSDWRREQISSLVKEIRADLGTGKDRPLLTAAVWADKEVALNRKLQDWPRWCKEGWLDAVLPMNYATDASDFRTSAEAVVELAGKTPVWLGIGSWRLRPAETSERIALVRELGLAGFSLFSYGGITEEGRSDAYLTELRGAVLDLAKE